MDQEGRSAANERLTKLFYLLLLEGKKKELKQLLKLLT
jgi:hypothetical protein